MSTGPNPLQTAVDDLRAQVENMTSVSDGASVLLNRIPALIDDAYNRGLAAGATPEQLQSLADLRDALQSEATELATAIEANTPPL